MLGSWCWGGLLCWADGCKIYLKDLEYKKLMIEKMKKEAKNEK